MKVSSPLVWTTWFFDLKPNKFPYFWSGTRPDSSTENWGSSLRSGLESAQINKMETEQVGLVLKKFPHFWLPVPILMKTSKFCKLFAQMWSRINLVSSAGSQKSSLKSGRGPNESPHLLGLVLVFIHWKPNKFLHIWSRTGLQARFSTWILMFPHPCSRTQSVFSTFLIYCQPNKLSLV